MIDSQVDVNYYIFKGFFWGIMGKINTDQSFIEDIVRQALMHCVPDSTAAEGEISPAVKDLFKSPETEHIKEEIVRTGKKLWDREYVDGNGGNISYRLNSDYVLCTPTLCSKADLKVEELCLVDMQNRKIFGELEQSSEIRLHLEVYKSVPNARAVVHCHPPHATAYAITGQVPPVAIIPEAEVFVGPIALAPYETPGTQTFAETIRPYVQDHNTILLSNHGIVCWADTVTHAEWYVEVADTYCRTLMLASSLGAPIKEIPPEKIAELLRVKQKLGLPDSRLGSPEVTPQSGGVPGPSTAKAPVNPRDEAFDALVANVTQQIVRFMNANNKDNEDSSKELSMAQGTDR